MGWSEPIKKGKINMNVFKLKKEFWDLIVAGKKTKEYRKLEKGYTSGEYGVIDAETGKWLGTMILEPINIFSKSSDNSAWLFFKDWDFNFLKENYKDKYDFVEYKIVSFKDFR